MTNEELKKTLHATVSGLEDLRDRALNLQNKNLSDVATSALGRVKQLIDHPDLSMVADDAAANDTDKPTQEPAPFVPPSADRGRLPVQSTPFPNAVQD